MKLKANVFSSVHLTWRRIVAGRKNNSFLKASVSKVSSSSRVTLAVAQAVSLSMALLVQPQNRFHFQKVETERPLYDRSFTQEPQKYFENHTGYIRDESCENNVGSESDDGTDFSTKDTDVMLRNATDVLSDEGIVALPTDTIYGIAALAQSTQAVKKIYEIKGRDSNKPLAICVGDYTQVKSWCHVTIPEGLLKQLLPGPVTLIFKRSDALNKGLNPGTSLVGIRIPDHNFIRQVCNGVNQPIALTSANISNHPSALEPQEFKELHDQLDYVCDFGCLGTSTVQRLGSTVVDLSRKGYYKIIREGCASTETRHKLEKCNLKEEIK